METVAGDISIDATKIGMLANAAIVEAVAAAIEELQLPLVVLDPVMVAKSGDALLEADAVAAMRSELLARVTVVTPNAMEAERLAGCPVRTVSDARAAARRIHELGARAVLVKGGHLETDQAVDVLYDGHEFTELAAPRIATRHTHGTGCTLAAAIAAQLALGCRLAEAVARAKRYVAGAIAHGLAIGRGNGPLDHFWNGVGRYT
jgi:hydroxymethylpyrimidine/phosphomethylpyrimidine kinase